MTFARMIAVGWWARESGMVETPKSKTCGRSPSCGDHRPDLDRYRDPRRAPRPLALPLRVPRSGARGIVGELLGIGEINAHKRIVADVSFDLDDIDAAFEELDARYLDRRSRRHPHTWSVVSGAYASINRHELFATTPNWVNVDHARTQDHRSKVASTHRSFQCGSWYRTSHFRIEAVHRLSNLGAVCTHVAHGVSQDGFDAEWRGVELLTVEGDLINRCEIFDEADLDAAIAKFEELHPQAPRLENTTSQMVAQVPNTFCGSRLGRDGGTTRRGHLLR